MTDIEAKALALLNEVLAERVHWQMTGTRAENASLEALCRAIEQHEATKQEFDNFRQYVSDAVMAYFGEGPQYVPHDIELAQFIIPAPKPDPLVDVLLEMELSSDPEEGQHDAKYLRAKLDARGFEIREKNDGGR